MKIEVKAFFGEWHEVSREQAQNFVKHLMSGMQAISGDENKAARIELRHLRGITVKELLN